MARTPKAQDEYSEEETARRRDAALERMLNTPPKPHNPTQKGDGSKAFSKPRRKKERDAR